MSKRLGLLIVMMLFVSLMTGCFGGDDSSTPTPAATSSVVITGTIPALSAPAGAPNYMVNYGTNYEMGVFNAATMTEITGSAVVLNGTSYTATVPASAASVTALAVIRHKATGKVVYSALIGILPTAAQMSAASITKVTVSGINLDGESTALATIAKDKGVVAPSIPASTSVTSMSATVKSEISTAVGAATVTAIKDAITAVQTVLNASTGVSEATKSSILSALDAALTNVLNAFVAAVKDASGVITSAGGATTVTVGGSTINSTTTSAQITDAVNHVTVVTVTAVTDPSDIAVASGTAVSAITFPTTVTVTMSNATTATRNVVWSTTSTPAYNANVAGAYSFTGTVDGTTLKATVKVNVGIIQLKAATPTFSPAAGTYTAAQSVALATTTDGATIHYTVDGSEPTTASPTYTTAIAVSATTTIKAIAAKTGMSVSDVATATYTISISLIPVISAERAVKQANGDVVVTWTTNIVTPTAAKVVISGSVPVPTDPSVTETVSTTTSHTVTIPAATFPASYEKLTISYYIASVDDGTKKDILKSAIIEEANLVADPVITPAAGTYTSAQSVTLTCATTGASIYYTIDGSTPNSLSTLYSGAISLSTSGTTTVKAIAIKTGLTDSAVVSATYVINISTSKVLTGITLAASEGTVEANVAYTMPVATAAYDDSTTGTVTATWVEVLEGGTAAVTLPVTKTTAGTYVFMASYTENGVTKTANFTLVVTEPVPVKTLQSITVTPTALSDMLINATQAVSLKVVANYLTGAVESTEEVTTSATVTASAGSYASGVYTAGATAGAATLTVSYTDGTTVKTGTITVTVTDAPPVVTTVEVTAIALVENAATQAVVLVKDQFGATMTTGFTLTYAMSNSVATVSTTGLVTAGAYNSSATTGTLTVTATPTLAGGTAVTGTATVTVSADTVKPVLVSVSAENNKVFTAVFSKKLEATEALKATNYKLYNVAKGTMTEMVATGAASGSKVAATLAFTDETRTSVKFTITQVNAGSALDGFPAGGLDAVSYRLYVSNVKDTAGVANVILAESNQLFTGTTTPDSSAPAISSASYDSVLGQLTITFDKTPQAVSATNGAKYSIVSGTTTEVLTNVGGSLQADNLSLLFTLTSAQKANLGVLASGATANIAVGGVLDLAGNANTAILTKTLTSTNRPALTAAAYDGATNKLTLTFNQVLNVSGSTFVASNKFQMISTEMSSGFYLGAEDSVITASNASVVEILLSTSHATSIESISAHTNAKVKVAADAVVNAGGDKNVAQDDSDSLHPSVPFTITYDTVKPAIASITYTESTRKLVFNFNVPVVKNDFVAAGVTFYSDKDNVSLGQTLGALTASEVSDSTTLTFELSATAVGGTIDATDLKAVQQGKLDADTPNSYNAYVQIAADTFKKSGGGTLKNLAVTAKADATTVVYNDNQGPIINAAITVTNKNTITVVYDEKVNKTDAETAANYKIWLMSGQTKVSALAVNRATMTDSASDSLVADKFGKKTVQLITATQSTAGSYLLEIANVKDIAATPNTISSTDATKYSKTFVGSDQNSPNPVPVSAKIYDTNLNGTLNDGDYIAVTYDRPVKINTTIAATQVIGHNTAANTNNFTLGGGGAFPNDYAAANNIMMSTNSSDPTDKVVWIKYDGTSTGAAAITVGTTTIAGAAGSANLVLDKYTDVAAGAGAGVTINSPNGAIEISEALLTDVDNSGTINENDTLKLTFSTPLFVDTGITLAANTHVITENTRSFGTTATVTTAMTTTASSNTLTVTFKGTGIDLVPTDVKTGEDVHIAASTLKDSWGIFIKAATVKVITTATVAAPYITKVEWVDTFGKTGGNVVAGADGLGNTGDYLYVTFNVPVYVNAPTNHTSSGASALNTWTIAGSNMASYLYNVEKSVADHKVLKLQLGNTTNNIAVAEASTDQTITPGNTSFDVNYTNMASSITNFAGDRVVTVASTGGTTPVINVPSDITAPTITSLEFVSENKIKAVFSKAVNVDNYDVADPKGLNINDSTSREIASMVVDTNDATGKTVVFTIEANATISEQQNGIASTTTTGLKINAGNGITDLSGNALAATAAGTNFIAIAKDTTAPDAALLGYELNTYKANLVHTNGAAGVIKENNVSAIACGELALLEVYFGASTPAVDATRAGVSAAYATSLAKNTNAITGLSMATTSHKIFYRLVDRASNKSAWLDSGNVVVAAVLADATYTKKLSSSNTANHAYLTGNTLYVGNATNDGTVAYDVTNNATVKSIMTNIAENDTFTIASGLVSVVSATNIAGAATITITAAQCAASVDVTSHATNVLSIEGSAATQATNWVVKGGAVTLSNTNLTGTINASTADSTLTAGTKAITTSGAFTFTVTTTGLVTIGNGGTAVISGVTVPGTTAATVQQTGTVLAIGGTAAGAVVVDTAATITEITVNNTTVTSLTNNKATLASLTVAAGKTLSTLTNVAAKTITTLTNAGTISTLTNTGTITTLTATAATTVSGTGTIGTLAVPTGITATIAASAVQTINTAFTVAGTGKILVKGTGKVIVADAALTATAADRVLTMEGTSIVDISAAGTGKDITLNSDGTGGNVVVLLKAAGAPEVYKNGTFAAGEGTIIGNTVGLTYTIAKLAGTAVTTTYGVNSQVTFAFAADSNITIDATDVTE